MILYGVYDIIRPDGTGLTRKSDDTCTFRLSGQSDGTIWPNWKAGDNTTILLMKAQIGLKMLEERRRHNRNTITN